FLEDGFADRTAHRVRAGLEFGTAHGNPDRVATLLHDGLADRPADRIRHLLVGALTDRDHFGFGLALHHRMLHGHLDCDAHPAPGIVTGTQRVRTRCTGRQTV